MLFSLSEVICGLLLLIPLTKIVGIYIALAIYASATSIVGFSLVINKEEQSCGCFGDLLEEKASFQKLIINLLVISFFIVILFYTVSFYSIVGVLLGFMLIGLKLTIAYIKKYTILLN